MVGEKENGGRVGRGKDKQQLQAVNICPQCRPGVIPVNTESQISWFSVKLDGCR